MATTRVASDHGLADGRARELVALAMLEIPGAAVLVFDRDLRIVMLRGASGGAFANKPGALEGHRVPDVLGPEWSGLGALFEQACSGGVASAMWQSADGTRQHLIRTVAVRSRSGGILGGVCLAADISDLGTSAWDGLPESSAGSCLPATPRGEVLDAGDRSACDALTGLPTVAGFREGLSRIVSHPPRAHQRLALVHVAVNGLTAVNEEHGRAGGDRVLAICGQRMRSLLRADDLLARLDGDEFLALVTGIQNPSDARRVADHLHSVVTAPIPLDDGHEVTVSMSVGVVMAEPDDSVEDTIEKGRNAVSRAKAAGGARTLFSDR
ncbi:MAG TPA: diguanylate cyclase [Dermatophilaceae bacterium]|nr:diguanylate cyclase [Dermatophilaceae bacterium]